MDKFLWDTCVYFSPMHILRTSDASPPHSMLGINWSTCSPADYFPPSNIERGGGGCKRTQNMWQKVIWKIKCCTVPMNFVHDCRTALWKLNILSLESWKVPGPLIKNSELGHKSYNLLSAGNLDIRKKKFFTFCSSDHVDL